jgi:predicted nucleic acid-binding Zn ribbon protein
MPTYVYRFIDTGETIEVRQSFEDDALTQAPHPSDGVLRPVKKVFTPVGVTFKGSGFYKTDSGGAKKSPAASTTATSADSGAAAAPKADGGGTGGTGGSSTAAASGGTSAAAPSAPSTPST